MLSGRGHFDYGPPVKTTSHDASSVTRAGVLVIAAQIGATVCRNAAINLAAWCRFLARAPRAHTPPLPVSAVAVAAAVLGATIVSMFLLDARAAEWAQHLPVWVRGVFEHITRFGLGGWFLFPFGSIVIILAAANSASLPRMTRAVLSLLAARFGFLFLAIGAPGLFTSIAKYVIGRARPFVGGRDDPFAYMPFNWHPAYASLPSGHSTNAVAAAIAIGAIWPSARPVLWLYALLIMASRVIVLAHHPSDVLAGALVGAVGAVLMRRAFAKRRLEFSPRDLAPYRGPSLRRIGAALRRVFSP
jgi:membrane-associated phospholipid phosphatase